MRRKTLLYLIAVILAAAVGYQFIGHDVPVGQQALADLNGDSLEAFKQQFNAVSDRIRVILLLSPT